MGGGPVSFRAEDGSAYINVTLLCGAGGWQVGPPAALSIAPPQVWDAGRQDFGHCFLDLGIMLPAQVPGREGSLTLSRPCWPWCRPTTSASRPASGT
jgi:hypothetical protein